MKVVVVVGIPFRLVFLCEVVFALGGLVFDMQAEDGLAAVVANDGMLAHG